MIAPLRELTHEETDQGRALSATALQVAATLLPPRDAEEPAPPVPAWQAWLLVLWLVATCVSYVAITLGLWTG